MTQSATVGEMVREIRRRAGVSQEALAERLHSSQRSVARLERAGDRVPLARLVRVAHALGLKIKVTIEAVNDEKRT